MSKGGSARRLGMLACASLFSLSGCGGGEDAPPPPPPNQAPAIAARATATVEENKAGIVYIAIATDGNNDHLTFSISGGTDAAAFNISSAGELSFRTPPDFELPTDVKPRDFHTNVYTVEITVTDGKETAKQLLDVTVTDIKTSPFRARKVASGFDRPNNLVTLPNQPDRALVVEKAGRVRMLTLSSGAIASRAFLDVSAEISTDGERGLIGFAVTPDFAQSGTVYAAMTVGGNLEVRRYRTRPQDIDQADPASADVILSIPNPNNVKVGGWIGFGPEGFLYIGSGAGAEMGENSTDLLGKIMRIDVNRDAFPNDSRRDYAIPTDNPFAVAGGAPEIWVLGMLNPQHASFDTGTGFLWVNDYGYSEYGLYTYEINLVRPADAGRNYSPVRNLRIPIEPAVSDNFRYPVIGESRGLAPSQPGDFGLIGGVVYRGRSESLQGLYVMGHRKFKDLTSYTAASYTLNQLDNGAKRGGSLNLGPVTGPVSGFGQDKDGNIYILSPTGDVHIVEAI